jgi:hypothetical protein
LTDTRTGTEKDIGGASAKPAAVAPAALGPGAWAFGKCQVAAPPARGLAEAARDAAWPAIRTAGVTGADERVSQPATASPVPVSSRPPAATALASRAGEGGCRLRIVSCPFCPMPAARSALGGSLPQPSGTGVVLVPGGAGAWWRGGVVRMPAAGG